jgi:hypothetical protein
MMRFDRLWWVFFLSAAALVPAANCAQGTSPSASSEGGGGESSTSFESSSAASSSSAVGAGGMGGAGGGGGGAGGGEGGAGGGGMPSAVLAYIFTSSLYMNCTPGGTPTVAGSFESYYDNKAGMSPALPAVKSTKLTMTYVGNSYEWTFKVTPDSSIVPAGSTATVKHDADVGSGTGMGMLCDYCGGVWTLHVTWDLGGKTATDTLGPQPVMCVQ